MTAVALKGLLGRKLRSVLTGLAIVLGVSMISGATRSASPSMGPLPSTSAAGPDTGRTPEAARRSGDPSSSW